MRKLKFPLILLLFLITSCTKKGTKEGTGTYGVQGVVSELFTNVYCHNCPEAEAFLDSLLSVNPKVIVIEYHMYLGTFSDSMYIEAKDYCDSRWNYYESGTVVGLPICYFGGVYRNEGISNIDSWANQINDLLESTSPCSISVRITNYDQNTHEGNVSVSIYGSYESSLKLRLCLVESNVIYRYQNADTLYNNVLRAMFPDPQGIEVSPPDTKEIGFTVSENWNPQNIRIVAFLQDDSTKEIVQATSIPLIP